MNRSRETVSILIVDDTPEHIKTAGAILKTLGYPIRAASNAEHALRLIEKQVPTVLLLDIAMPGMDGFELMRQLSKYPFYADMAILCVTASSDRQSIEQGFALGARDYVVKPYHPSELLARVKNHIQLVIQAKELKHSYEELDQFCLNVSHDLRSPLYTVCQLCDLLERSCEDSRSTQTRAILKRIRAKSSQTAKMAERLLDLSRVSQKECQKETVNLNLLMSSVFEDLKNLNPDRNLIFSSDTIPEIQGYPDLLRILFQNILGNAVKFTRGRNPAKINVSFQSSGDTVTLAVCDNGVGFDPECGGKLFRVFERLHTQEEFEGTGVGLVIAKRIMRHHSGSIQINGKPGHGACVILSFPA